jgi:uncharacterized protein
MLIFALKATDKRWHYGNLTKQHGRKYRKMTNIQQILQILGRMRPELAMRFTVERIGVFGSFARGDDTPGSDLDIVVELVEPTFDHYMDLKFLLEEVLMRPVDLVMADTVKPRLKPIIERETVYA